MRIHWECSDFNCPINGVTVAPGDPDPQSCPCGQSLTTSGCPTDDEDEDDADFPSPSADGSPRPGWTAGRRKDIKDRARTSPSRTNLYCGICARKIEVNARGKEVWKSKSGKTHVTSPHVDHYGSKPIPKALTGGVAGVKGDWAERKRVLRDSAAHMSKPEAERTQIERAVYNASPLRTAHMKCNCGRPKFKPY